MGTLKRAFDILLYTNVWIAGAASALYLYSHYMMHGQFGESYVPLLILTTCTWLYSLHRFIGLRKVEILDKEDRFFKIKDLEKTIFTIGVISLLISAGLAFTLSLNQLLVLSAPGILSLLYVLPVFKNRKRLRDINYVKIFIISLVWAGLTVVLPAATAIGLASYLLIIVLAIERFLFIFAITLPFDIRDIVVDRLTGVETISARMGASKTLYLSVCLLLICTLLILLLCLTNYLPWMYLTIHLLVNLLTAGSIGLALRNKHDWYFTGLIDGTMYLPFLLLFLYLISYAW